MAWLISMLYVLGKNEMDIPITHISNKPIKHPYLEGLGLGLLFGVVPIIFSMALIYIFDRM